MKGTGFHLSKRRSCGITYPFTDSIFCYLFCKCTSLFFSVLHRYKSFIGLYQTVGTPNGDLLEVKVSATWCSLDLSCHYLSY